MAISLIDVKAFALTAKAGLNFASKMAKEGDAALSYVTQGLEDASGALTKLMSSGGQGSQGVIGAGVNFAHNARSGVDGLLTAAHAGVLPSASAIDTVAGRFQLLAATIGKMG